MKEIRAVRKDIFLVLAGGRGHNYDTNIDKTIKEYELSKEVFLPGYIDEEDKSTLFMAAEASCLPSFYEGFGIPVLEAMSLGVPVLVSDIGPHREVAGQAAVFFDPHDAGDLARKATTLLGDEEMKRIYSERGIIQAKNFSWRKTAEKIRSFFEECGKKSD